MACGTSVRRNSSLKQEQALAGQRPHLRLFAADSPLGFNAGDTNLYRYVGDSPISFSDPDGLQKKPSAVASGSNPTRDGLFDQFLNNPVLVLPGYKNAVIDQFGPLKSTKIPIARPIDPTKTVGCAAGKNVTVTNPPPGSLVGSQAADTCIGVIVTTPPDKSGNVYVHVFHFQGTDSISEPLSTALRDCPIGSHVAFFGGNREPGSNNTLVKVVKYFFNPNGEDPVNRFEDGSFISDGFSDTTGLWTDGKGNYYTYTGDKPSQNK